MTTKTCAWLLLALLTAGRLAAQTPNATQPPTQRGRLDTVTAPTAEVNGPKDRLAGYTDSVNRRNLADVVACFTDDAMLTDLDGNVARGSSMIREEFARDFAAPTKYTLESAAESIRFLTPDVA